MNKGPRKHGILEKDLNDIVSILAGNPFTEKVVLFGSRARQKPEPGSDIDIAWYGKGLVIKDITKAQIQYDELYLPYKLDLVLYHIINEVALLDHIDRSGIVLYEKG